MNPLPVKDLPERVGQLADRIDSLMSAESLPIPAAIAKQGRTGALRNIRDELRAIACDAFGYNPWETHS